ncbi:MAG TPA: PIN domain-containing protein [Anaerolineae bacterium]|nr:PIN domain-containing protein [Anaerolineae bacterium]
MNAKRVFVDTNIFVYAKLEDDSTHLKRRQAAELLGSFEEPVISVQVLNEFSNVLLKHGISDALIREAVQTIVEDCMVYSLTLQTIELAWEIKVRYRFSYWDSLILAAALENDCDTLYSEDLQDGQVIEGKLQLVNPFTQD